MLLTDGGAARLPAISELGEIGDHEVAEERVETDRAERPVERRLGSRLVETLESAGELATIGRSRPVCRRVLGNHLIRQPGGLGSRESLLLVRAHSADACDVSRRVETEAPGRPRRAQEPVAMLPGAEQLGAHADAATQLPDPQMSGFGHPPDLTEPRRCLYINSP